MTSSLPEINFLAAVDNQLIGIDRASNDDEQRPVLDAGDFSRRRIRSDRQSASWYRSIPLPQRHSPPPLNLLICISARGHRCSSTFGNRKPPTDGTAFNQNSTISNKFTYKFSRFKWIRIWIKLIFLNEKFSRQMASIVRISTSSGPNETNLKWIEDCPAPAAGALISGRLMRCQCTWTEGKKNLEEKITGERNGKYTAGLTNASPNTFTPLLGHHRLLLDRPFRKLKIISFIFLVAFVSNF